MYKLLFFIAFSWFLSGCVSIVKHRTTVREYKQMLYEADLNTNIANYSAEKLNLKIRQSKTKENELLDSLAKQEYLIEQLRQEINALNKDSKAVANLIAEKKHFMQEYANVQKRFEQHKKIDKKFFPFPTMSGRVELFHNSFDFYIVNLRKTKIDFFWKNRNGEIFKSFLGLKSKYDNTKYELKFATNGGMYTNDFSPQGLFVSNGRELQSIDLRKEAYGNFYMQPNGIFLIDKRNRAHVIATDNYRHFKKSTKHATQSGPALLLDNKMNAHFNKGSKNKYIRSGVGIISPYKVVFVISNKPVNFYDFATLFRDYFGCADALYLDGAISKMYLPSLNRNQLGGNFGPLIGVVKKK